MPTLIQTLDTTAQAILDALREVMREDDLHHPCDHPIDPTGTNGCTHCHARAVIAEHDRRAA